MQADPEVIDKLAYYLWFAEYAYEAGTEPNLKKVLASRGKLFPYVSVSCADVMHVLDTPARAGGGERLWQRLQMQHKRTSKAYHQMLRW